MRLLGLSWVLFALLACEPPPSLERAPARGETFDEESRRIYGVVAPPPDEREMSSARAELGRLLPGKGPLAARYASFQKRFLVAPEKLEDALGGALEESRLRTLEYLDLPSEESVRIEYVSGAPWPSFARYDGNHRSVVQVNRDFPLTVSSLLEIATHEAYPGHHTLNVLRRAREADALLEEGLATYGLELAFPGEERLAFERDVLFPLAGLDPAEAEHHARVEREMRRLAPLRVEGARAYLDGKRDRVQSVIWLEHEALVPAPWAFLRFVDQYRTYVVTYTVGPELVRERIGWGGWQEYLSMWMESE